MASRVLLSRQAVKDLDKLGPESRRVANVLEALARYPRPANLELKTLRGHAPWSRARSGRFRVIVRPLTEDEVRMLPGAPTRGYLVARIIHRRDLERVIAAL